MSKDVSNFLIQFPPFYYFSKITFDKLLATIESIQLEKNQELFREDDPSHHYIYILHQGQLELWKNSDTDIRLIDICKEGELVGCQAAISNTNYLFAARATEESHLYALPAKDFFNAVELHVQAAVFLAKGFALGVPTLRKEIKKTSRKKTMFSNYKPLPFMRTEDVLSPQPIKDIVTCTIDTPANVAAQMIKKRKFGSVVVVDEHKNPIGIATETDFVRKIIAATQPNTVRIDEIMSSPVFTIRAGASVAQIILAMTHHQVNHLVITQDGTPKSKVVGIISEHDVLLMHGNHPAVLVKRIAKAQDIRQLKQIRDRADDLIFNYLQQQISVPFIGQVSSEVNDILIHRAIEIALEQMKSTGLALPQQNFCWLSLGSEGRQEQMLRTDQDNAILYENPPEDQSEDVHNFFHELGCRVVEILSQCGYSRCKGDIMASNRQWVQPLQIWTKYFAEWIKSIEPDAMRKMSIFFDFRPVYGNKTLSKNLRDNIFSLLEKRQHFLNLFVQSALQHPPPQGFLGRFLVETTGENKHLFNIKARSLRPLDHAARVLSLAHNIYEVNTFERYKHLARILPEKELFTEAMMAYEIFLRYRMLNGFQNQSDGTYIRIEQLNEIEKQTLKTCFKAIARIQRYMQVMFPLPTGWPR